MTLQDQLGVLQGLSALGATAALIALAVPDAGLWLARQLKAHSTAQRAARSAYRVVRQTDLLLGGALKGRDAGVVQIDHTGRDGSGELIETGLPVCEAATISTKSDSAQAPGDGGRAA